MKTSKCCFSLLLSTLVLKGLIGCGREAPKAGDQNKPAAPSTPATDSTGQAIVDSIKTPLDKSRQVEGILGKAAEKTADTIKDPTP